MNEAYNLTMPWPDRGLQSNARGRGYQKKARLTAKARQFAWGMCLEKNNAIPCIPNAVIFIEYYPKSYRGDVHNVPSSLKAYIDGIAQAMGCDDKNFRVNYPDVWAGKSNPATVVFRIMHPAL